MASEHDRCLDSWKSYFQADLLSNKVAFITGGGSGICFRIAEGFMRHGCDTIIASRKLARVEESAQHLSSVTGRRCMPIAMDVRSPQDVDAAFDAALNEFGKIDILVNGAAGNFLCPAAALSANGMRTVMEIDFLGTFHCSKAAYTKYFAQHGGVILNISATLDYRGRVLQLHAGAAKAAIDAMSRHLAVEWGPDGVRVNSLAPGPIADTEGFRRLGGKALSDTIRKERSKTIPAQRFGSRKDMAEAALFLVSDASAYVTGTVLVADGGAWMGGENSMVMAKRMMSKL